MSNSAPVIVVTGGNRGIGFEICRQLASRGAQVVLTARQPEAGQAAASRLASRKPAAQFHPLNAVTGILAAELRDAVAVNSMCSGWVKTDLGGANAERDVSQGADTAVWLALDAPQDLTGKFLRDRKVIPW